MKRRLYLTMLALGLVIGLLGTQATLAREPEEARPSPQATDGGSLTVTKDDSLVGDTNNNGQANPGETLRYTIGLTNTTAASLTSVVVSDVLDSVLTFVPGSLQVSPIAVPDSYTAVGNTRLIVEPTAGTGGGAVNISGSVLDNDQSPDGDALTVTAGTFATVNGGSVTVNTDGSFNYLPPAAFTGTDTWTYQLTDGTFTVNGMVSITVSNMVWYIDPAAAGGGTGRVDAPFNALAPVSGVGGVGDADAAGHIIYLNTGTYNQGVILEADQHVIGEGVALVVNGFTIYPAGARPTLTSAGDAIILGTNNTLAGFNISGVNSPNVAIQGNAFGTLNVSSVNIVISGNLLNLTTGTVNAVFDGLSTNVSTTAINLNGVSGTFSSVSTTIEATTTGINIQNSPTLQFSPNTTGVLSIITTAGTGIIANNGGTLNINGTASTINATGGPALDLTNTSLSTGATFANVSSTNSTGRGISLTSVTGNLVINGGSISGSTNQAIYINGGANTISFAGSITNSSNRSVEILNRTDGSVTFAGNITDTGTGIFVHDNTGGTVTFSGASKSFTMAGTNNAVTLTNNTGATINFFNGGLVIASATGTGFSATGGGTIAVTGTGNTISAIGGTALSVQNTTIGANGMTFQSISSANATYGLRLNNAGSGGFTVTGSGATNGSGGTIQNASQRGIEIISTNGVSLRDMTISSSSTTNGANTCDGLNNTGCNAGVYLHTVSNAVLNNVDIGGSAQQGLNGYIVTNLVFANSIIANNGNEVNEHGIYLRELAGTSSLNNITVQGSADRNVYIENRANVTLNLTVSNSTFRDNSTTLGADGFEGNFFAGTANIDITNSSFLRNRTWGIQILAQDTSVVSANISGNTINSGSGLGNGLEIAANNSATLNMNIIGNPEIGANSGTAINIFGAGTSTINGRINDNPNIYVIDPASDPGQLTLVNFRVAIEDSAQAKLDIKRNIINNNSATTGADIGIQAFVRYDSASRLDTFIENNQVNLDSNRSLYGIEVRAQNNDTHCSYVANNTVSGVLIVFRERTSEVGATVLLEGWTGTVAGTWGGNGNTPASTVSASNNGTVGLGTCVVPLHPLPRPAEAREALTETTTAVEPSSFDMAAELLETASVASLSAPAMVRAQPVDAFQTRTELSKVFRTGVTSVNAEINAVQGAGTFPVNIGTLPANSSVTIIFDALIANPVPVGAESISNQATVTSSAGSFVSDDPATVALDDPTLTTLVAAPNLALTKSDGNVTVVPGDTIVYTLNYTNTGNQAAGTTVITETVPAHTTFNASSSTAGWSCADGSPAPTSCTFAVGTVAGAGGAGSATFAVTVNNPVAAGVSQISNTASIGASEADAVPANNSGSDTTPVDAEPDLVVTKSDAGITATPNDTITYTIAYTNTGNQAATGVTLTETVPAHTTFNAGASSAGWSCADGSAAGTTCTLPVGGLVADASGSATFAVTVVSNLPVGVTQTTNTVTISDDGANGTDPTSANNSATEPTTLSAEPNLAISKTDGGISAVPGQTFVYTLTYTNTGTRASSNTVLTETVPLYTTFDAGASSAGWSCADGAAAGVTCTLAAGTVAVNSNATALFAVTVNSALPIGAEVTTNTVQIGDDGANGLDPDLADNEATDTTPLTAAPNLVLSKTDASITVAPGASITYTLNYTNTGNQVAGSTVLTETVPAHTTFNAAASTAGWSCTPDGSAGSSCTFAVGTVAVAANGSVSFGVTVVNPVAAGVNQISNVAQIAASEADAVPSDNTASETTPVNAQPDLVITKSDGEISAVPGQTVAYTLLVTNQGNQGATGVVITETVPANTTFNLGLSSPGWSCANGSAAGTTCTFSVGALDGAGDTVAALFAVTVNASIPAGVNQISNTATVADDESNGADPTPANNSSTDTTPVTAAPDLAVTKSDGGITAVPGGAITYTLSYTNSGTRGASGVVLTELVPAYTTFNAGASSAGWSCADGAVAGTICTLNVAGSVAVGSNATAIFAVTVDSAVSIEAEQTENVVSISDDGFNGADENPADNEDSIFTPIDADPAFVLVKSDGAISVEPGDLITYTLTYTNTGNQAAHIVIEDLLPDYTSFVSAGSSADWLCDGVCTISISNVEAGESGAVTFVVQVDATVPAGVTEIVNEAILRDDAGTPQYAQATETTPLIAAPDLSISKSDGAISALPGQTVAYTLTISNVGNQGATGVVITETVPANTTFNPGASTSGWVCTPDNNAGSSCVLNLAGELAAGDTQAPVFAVTVAATLPAGVDQVSNTATVVDDGTNGTDPTSSNNSSTDTTPVTAAPDLTISKSDGGTSSVPGATIVYTLSYSNVGTQDATGVELTETVPVNTTFNAASSSAGWSCADGAAAGSSCTLADGSLSVGTSGSATFSVMVDSPLAAGVDTISNTADIVDDAANGADENTVNNSATDTTSVIAQSDLVVVKSTTQTQAVPGGAITYTIAVTNTGNQNTNGVVIEDVVPVHTTFNAAASSAGWVCDPDNSAGSVCSLAIPGDLAGGASVSYTFVVDVLPTVPAGTEVISNTATVGDSEVNGADPTPENNTSTVVVPLIAAPDLELAKSDGAISVAPGATISYSLTISNTGDQDATNLVLTETVPLYTTFDAASSAAGWTCTPDASANSSCTYSALPSLAAGSSATVVFAVTVDALIPSGVTEINNTASVAEDGTNGADATPANNAASDTTPLDLTSDAQVAKSVSSTLVRPGDTISYTINVVLTGDVVTALTLTDVLPVEVINSSYSFSGDIAWTEVTAAPNLVLQAAAVAPVASSTIIITATVDPSLINEQAFTNTVTLENGSETAPVDNTASAVSAINVAPVANAGGPYTVDEGSSVTLSAAASTDVGALSYAWDFDEDGVFDDATGVTVVFTNTLDDAVYTVAVLVTDQFNATDVATTTVTVLNVAPTVDAGLDQSTIAGQALALTGVFTDPGVLDTHTIEWDFGDGNFSTGSLTATHTWTTPGFYTVTLTITDDDNGVGSDTLVVEVRSGKVFLPFVSRPRALPDVVIEDVTLTADTIRFTIRNVGNAPVTDGFWIDLYLDPQTPPTGVNQIWQNLGDYGAVWGISDQLAPGAFMTVDLAHPSFRPDLSNLPAVINPGSNIYIQVDSANDGVATGAVLEFHEFYGLPYNNIRGPIFVSGQITPLTAPRATPVRPTVELPNRPAAR